MNVTSRRPSWRGAAVTSVAALALLVPAVAWATTTASAGTRTAEVSRCGGFSTYVWLADAPSGATGHVAYPIEFTNIGSRACWLEGFPGVQGLTASLRAIGAPAGRLTTPAHRVMIKPDQTAYALLIITNNAFIPGCHTATGGALGVYPPGQRLRQFVSNFTFPACTNKGYLAIMPVAPGIGVP